jgi:hypothetical protein
MTAPADPRQHSHSRIRVPRDSWPYFIVSDSRLPQPEGPGPRIYIPQERVAQLYPQSLVSLLVASYDSQGYGGGIGTRLQFGCPNNVFTKLFPSNSCYTAACLHSCYLAMGLHVTVLSKLCNLRSLLYRFAQAPVFSIPVREISESWEPLFLNCFIPDTTVSKMKPQDTWCLF